MDVSQGSPDLSQIDCYLSQIDLDMSQINRDLSQTHLAVSQNFADVSHIRSDVSQSNERVSRIDLDVSRSFRELPRSHALQDLPPKLLTGGRKFGEVSLDFADESFPERTREELLHIPGVLGTSRVKLEEDQIGRSDDEIAADRFGSLQEPRLPWVFPDDDIDRPFAASLESNHASQRIGQVSPTNLNGNAARSHRLPEVRLQTGGIGDEQVQIEGGTVDPIGGESNGTDQGMADPSRIEGRPDLLEQVHPISSDMHFEGVRLAWR
jgi:hypothetical protein